MNALISPDEIVITIDETVGWRIAQVAEKEFPVAEPLFWLECQDNVIADVYCYSPSLQQIVLAYQPELPNGAVPIMPINDFLEV